MDDSSPIAVVAAVWAESRLPSETCSPNGRPPRAWTFDAIRTTCRDSTHQHTRKNRMT